MDQVDHETEEGFAPIGGADVEQVIAANERGALRMRWTARLPLIATIVGGIGAVIFGLANLDDGNSVLFYAVAGVFSAFLLLVAVYESVSTGGRLSQLEGTLSRKVRWQKERVGQTPEVGHPTRGLEGIRYRESVISVMRRQIAAIYAVLAWNFFGFALTTGAALHVVFNNERTWFSFFTVSVGLWISTITVVGLIARRFGDLDFFVFKKS